MKQLFLLTALILTLCTTGALAQTKGTLDKLLLKVDSVVTDSVKAETAARPDGPSLDMDSLRQAIRQQRRMALNTYSRVLALKPEPVNPNIPFNSVTDDALQAVLLQRINFNMDKLRAQAANDTVHLGAVQKAPLSVGTLKQEVSLVTNDTLRAAYYHQIAGYYLRYDSISVKRTRANYQEAAIDFTIKAVHAYSKINDVKGMRGSFDDLVKVYKDQRKYSQAKWFILQSNTISRQLNDVPNIILSLNTLAGIKMQIRDYDLAKGDLNEALALCLQNRYAQQESEVQMNFARLYDHLNDPKKSVQAVKRHDFLLDSIAKSARAAQLAAARQDSVQAAKKKLYTAVSNRKNSVRGNSSKKVATL